jgi:DNA-directed RNA polymerase alpha subunit
MKKVSTVKNISNSPVLLNNKDGVAFSLMPGEEVYDYRKDSRFNDAKRRRRIQEETCVVEVESEQDEGLVDEDPSEMDESKNSEEEVDQFFFETPLSELPPSVQESLFNAGYNNHADVQRATDDELKSISGIGSARLDEIRDLVGRAGVESSDGLSEDDTDKNSSDENDMSEVENLETEDALN